MDNNCTPNTSLQNSSSLRISTDDIDEAIQQLENAFTEGRLDTRELEDRIEQALHAKTAHDLAIALLDLKPQERAITSTKAHSELPRLLETRAVYSDFEKSGPFILPKEYRVSEIFGSCMLDLRHAKLESTCTTIHLCAIYGNVKILVSRGIRVKIEGTSIMGDVTSTIDEADLLDGAPIIEIHAEKIYGGIKLSAKE